jgi:hypothetical protein
MSMTMYRDRRAATIENNELRVTVLEEGGHIAEVFDKQAGVNPLWTPPWPSIEPSTFDRARHRVYGDGADAKLLAGIMGHNVCLDMFGGPSPDELAAGLTPHGEGSVAPYQIDAGAAELTMRAILPIAHIRFERGMELHGRTVRIRESIKSLLAFDRAIGWTEHVTLGPPFLEKGVTEFRASAARSRVFEQAFGTGDCLSVGASFTWPTAPRADGGEVDLRRFTDAPRSSAYSAHLMDERREHAFFVAFHPATRLAFGYIWKRADFPWMGIWEENGSRANSPWNAQTIARGMEFGVSPMPESRRDMIDRGLLFDAPTYRWLPANGRLAVEYWVVMTGGDTIPERLDWPG